MPRQKRVPSSIIEQLVQHFMSAPVAEARQTLTIAAAIVNARSPQSVSTVAASGPTGVVPSGHAAVDAAVDAATGSAVGSFPSANAKPRRPRSPNGTRKPRVGAARGGRKPRHAVPEGLSTDVALPLAESLPDVAVAEVAADVVTG